MKASQRKRVSDVFIEHLLPYIMCSSPSFNVFSGRLSENKNSLSKRVFDMFFLLGKHWISFCFGTLYLMHLVEMSLLSPLKYMKCRVKAETRICILCPLNCITFFTWFCFEQLWQRKEIKWKKVNATSEYDIFLFIHFWRIHSID